jgi:hypothetical protein
VCAGNTETTQRVADTVLKVCSQFAPERIAGICSANPGAFVNAFRTDSCHEEEEITTRAITPEAVPRTEYKIYPNPVRDLLTIDVTGLEKPTSIKVVRSDGVLVKTIVPADGKQLVQVNTTGLTSGIYIVNIINSKGTKSFSFVKM